MKFNKVVQEAKAEEKLILDPTYNGSDKSKGVIKGKKDHNDESIEVGKNAKGQKPAGK